MWVVVFFFLVFLCVSVCVCVCVRVCMWRQQGNFIGVLHTFHSMHAHCIFYDQVLESIVSTTLYLSVPFLALPKLPSLSLVRHSRLHNHASHQVSCVHYLVNTAARSPAHL